MILVISLLRICNSDRPPPQRLAIRFSSYYSSPGADARVSAASDYAADTERRALLASEHRK